MSETLFLLSIDPGLYNTAICIWKKAQCKNNCWEAIKVISLSFKKNEKEMKQIFQEVKKCILINSVFSKPYICIERGIHNPKFGRGKESLDHLRGFICGQFDMLLRKEMLVANTSWKKWYIDSICKNIKLKEWTKNTSLKTANKLIILKNWNIENITNHDQADCILIGWYYINNKL